MSRFGTVTSDTAGVPDQDEAFGEDGDGDGQDFVADLSRATLVLDDLGGWSRVAPILPSDFTDPDRAAAAMSQALGTLLDAKAQGAVLPKSAKAFVAMAAQGWAAFVADPDRLVVETGFPADEIPRLDAEALADGPLGLIERLEPVVSRAPAAESAGISADLVRTAMEAPETLAPEARREVGLALLAGDGVPRSVDLGLSLLSGIDAGGDGEVLVALARARLATDAEGAYATALRAGGTGVPGLRGLLGRIEARLSFADRMRVQQEVAGPLPGPDALPATAGALRMAAEGRLAGTEAPRSLRHALYLASLAAARGDGAARRLLDRVDELVAPADRAVWTPIEREVSEAALAAWMARGR